jgi:hypothetical protein
MKNTIYIAFILLFATSCHVMRVPDTHKSTEPYVQLKNGQKFTGTSAERSSGLFVKDKIVLGDTSFRSRDVAFYSTGGTTFANVNKKTFAPQVASGKINLYRYASTTSTGSGSSKTTHHQINYFIQRMDGDPVKSLSYKHLAPMITANTPEFKMLEKYKRTRTVSRILGYGALGLIGGGLILANSNSSAADMGASVAGVGLLSFVSWTVLRFSTHGRLLNTVIIANKTDRANEHHSRVK